MTLHNGSVDAVVVRLDEHAGCRIEVPGDDRPLAVVVMLLAKSQEAPDFAAPLDSKAWFEAVGDSNAP